MTSPNIHCAVLGGAGGQHACLVADSLAIKRILIHPYAGVLSAYGMGLADTVVSRQHAVETVLTSSSYQDLTELFDQLQQAGVAELRRQGEDCEELESKHLLHIRYQGSDTALVVRHGLLKDVISQFEHLHQMRFGSSLSKKK